MAFRAPLNSPGLCEVSGCLEMANDDTNEFILAEKEYLRMGQRPQITFQAFDDGIRSDREQVVDGCVLSADSHALKAAAHPEEA